MSPTRYGGGRSSSCAWPSEHRGDEAAQRCRADHSRGSSRRRHPLRRSPRYLPDGRLPTFVGGEVIAVLTREAIQLPLGLTLSADSSELPLDRWTGPVRVGAGQVQVGDRSVRISRVVSVAAPTQLKPNRAAAGHAWPRLSGFGEPEPRPGRHWCIVRCHSTRTANSSVDRSKSTPGVPAGIRKEAALHRGPCRRGRAQEMFLRSHVGTAQCNIASATAVAPPRPLESPCAGWPSGVT